MPKFKNTINDTAAIVCRSTNNKLLRKYTE